MNPILRSPVAASAPFLGALAALACAFPADAQNAGPSLAEIEVRAEEEPVELQGRRARVTLDSTGLPAGLTVITPQELGTLNIGRDISNVFRRVPGVVANNIDQGDTGNGFRMRGFATQGTHGADTAVYVDGVPQNMPSSQAGAGHGPAFLEWLTPDMIGRIDVIKGPVSALYGDQNRAGAVAITTAEGAGVPSSVGVSLERYGGRRGSLVLSTEPASGLHSLLVADAYRTDSFRRDGRLERDNLMWKLSGRIGEGLYSLRLNRYSSDSVAPGYLLLPDLQAGRVDPRATQYGLPGFGSGERSALVFNRRPAQGEEGWYATAYAESFERVRGIATSEVQHTVGADHRRFHGGRLAYNAVFGDRAALIAGAELRQDKGDALRRIWRFGMPTGSYINNQALDLGTWGLFAQGQYRFDGGFKLLAGVRRDWLDYDILNRKLPQASTGWRDAVTTPKLGAAWRVSPALDLFANIAEGFRSPAAEQISSSGTTGPLGARGGTVYDVSPSKVRSLDLGFNAMPAPGWTLSGVVYRTLNQDEIVAQADGSYRSVGDTTRRGFELESRWQLSPAASVYGSYARILEARANNPLPNTGARLSVPRHQLKIGAEYRQPLGAGRLTLNADAYLTAGNPYYVGTPQTQLRTMPTYTRYDLKASYDWRQFQWSVFAVFQPHRFASDIAYGSAAGLLLAPQPRVQFGASMRYFF
jgi:outer membrane receptor protein involved in Fe transport